MEEPNSLQQFADSLTKAEVSAAAKEYGSDDLIAAGATYRFITDDAFANQKLSPTQEAAVQIANFVLPIVAEEIKARGLEEKYNQAYNEVVSKNVSGLSYMDVLNKNVERLQNTVKKRREAMVLMRRKIAFYTGASMAAAGIVYLIFRMMTAAKNN